MIDQFANIVSSRLKFPGIWMPGPWVGDGMRHAWILDVLTDLVTYAQGNGLPSIAMAAEQTLEVAKTEIAAISDTDQASAPD